MVVYGVVYDATADVYDEVVNASVLRVVAVSVMVTRMVRAMKLAAIVLMRWMMTAWWW